MDEPRLDGLIRYIAHRTGRRSLSTGALGGLLARLLSGPSATEAAGKKPKPRCKKPKRTCGKTCVNLKNNRQHCGKCHRRCKPLHACHQGKCTPLPCGKGGPCRVFLSSQIYPGNLGGLIGADEKCNTLAQAEGLPGLYKAWLSTASVAAATRLTHNPGPYVLTNGARPQTPGRT